jgi:hypothetical protein
MSIDLKSVTPVADDWFVPTAIYEGQGRAEFADPTGIVEGHTIVRFDSEGNGHVEMSIETVAPAQPLKYGTMQFFNGEPEILGEAATWSSNRKDSNPCTKLTVSTAEGEFISTEVPFYNTGFWGNTSIRFYLHRSWFDCSSAGEATCWVLPLSNFLSDFMEHNVELDRHPLRIYPTPIVPPAQTEQDAFGVWLTANQWNRLIVFSFRGELGFIERLVDYEESKAKLLAGQAASALTAVMVGAVGSGSIDLDAFEEWFPIDYLRILGLAIGNEVGAPWIEFRDSNGRLVRRAHVRLAHPWFGQGQKLIDEAIHRGTGQLLTNAALSEHWNQSYMRVALKNIVLGGLTEHTVEDRYGYLCRTLDGLCEQFKLKSMSPDEALGEECKAAVKAAIRLAHETIDNLADRAQSKGNNVEAKALKRIGSQVERAMIIQKSFGKAVLALLEKFNLPDGAILENHLAMHPRPDTKQWHEMLSYYRGLVMHRSYFDFRSGGLTLREIVKVINHLHDVLARIMLTMLGYDGHYNPTVSGILDNQPIDWVKIDTPASRLGYR